MERRKHSRSFKKSNSKSKFQKIKNHNSAILNPDLTFSFPSSDSLEDLNKSFNSDFHSDLSPIFFFINPKSGSHIGESVLSFASSIKFPYNTKYHRISLQSINDGVLMVINCICINIIESEALEEGIELLKTIQNSQKKKVKVLFGGGDGTIISLIDTFFKKQVDISKCSFAPVPFGTGNDLSNALGFGITTTVEENELSLFDLLFVYQNAYECKVDVWKLELKVEDRKGKICDVSNNKETEYVEKDENGKIVPLKFFNKSFINYASIGYEARVGFSFEKIRSSNRIINKFFYFWIAFKKYICICRRTKTLNDLVYSFQVGEVSVNKKEKQWKKFFSRKNILYEVGNSSTKLVLNGKPISIVCQNINYYLGGSRDIWKNSNYSGLTPVKFLNLEEELDNLSEKFSAEQRYDDKKLEFFGYESVISLGLENIYTGNANKIYHGPTPVKIVFRKNVRDKVYLNVDGEYFRVYNPEYIKIDNNDILCNGQLTFLRRGI